MDIVTATNELNDNEYGNEGSPALFDAMREAGLVAVFGASDDLMEFRGAIQDEIDCYAGGTAYLTSEGLVRRICDNDDCPHERDMQRRATRIDAKFDQNGFTWQYETPIPHRTFLIMEDGETYCEGIVFALSDVPS